MNDAIEAFKLIRDVPYRIPLFWGDKDDCCSGKSTRLLSTLKKLGYKARYRVCVFHWSDLDLPKKLQAVPHDNDCTHSYLEVKIAGDWKIVDPTWDIGIKKKFHVNEWDGKSNTEIAVNPTKIFTPENSLRIMQNQDERVISQDLKVNGEFYKAFNEWLETIRAK